MSVLGDYEAASAEASKNFNFTAVDFDDDSHVRLVIDCHATLINALRIQLNSVTSGYSYDGRRISAGTETLIDGNSQSGVEVASTSLLVSVNGAANIIVDIMLGKGNSSDRFVIHSRSGTANDWAQEFFQLHLHLIH